MPAAKSKGAKEPTSDPNQVYSSGQIILGKIKGYPAWPGQVLEHDKAPVKVQKEKPKTKNINLVQFFPTAEYAWITSRDLSLLTPKEITSYVSGGKKKGQLLEGYKIAQDPSEWNQQRADEQAEYDELVAQNAEGEDQLASDGEDGGKKKRKRQSEGGKKDEKKGKKAKAEKSNGKKASKKDDDEPASKKSKSNGSDDAAAETVKTWRHKLQKVFLGKGAVSAEEMPKCAEHFDAMEAFDMKKEHLIESKLNKVLKRIAVMADDQIPDEEKHSFRDRSKALYTKWEALLTGGEAAAASGEAAPATEDDKPATNGDAAEETKENGEAKADESSEDKAEESAEEKKDEEKMEVDESEATKENGAKEAEAPAAAEETKEDDKVDESS